MRPRLFVYTEEFLSPSMTFIARQVDSLQAQFDVTVLTHARRNSSLFSFEPVQVVPISKSARVRGRVRRIFGGKEWEIRGRSQRALGAAIAQGTPSLIHAHFGPSGLAILPIARAHRIPLVTTFHGFDASSFLRRRAYRRELKDLFQYSEIVAVSEDMRRKLIAIGANASRTHCHYIGVPLAVFTVPKRVPIAEKQARGETIRFLQVSNFVEKKGHEFTVRAFSNLLGKHPDCELILVGSGPLQPRIERLVDEQRIRTRVRFLGHQSSHVVAALMREADCFVHHSVTTKGDDREGIPTALMEAMASGLPVISTRHSGIPELVEHGSDGLLVDERDVVAYVGAMTSVLQDTGDIGSRARLKVERLFDMDACSRGLGRLLRAVLCGEPAAPKRFPPS